MPAVLVVFNKVDTKLPEIQIAGAICHSKGHEQIKDSTLKDVKTN